MKRKRKNKKNNNLLLISLLGAGAAYFFLQKNKEVVPNNAPIKPPVNEYPNLPVFLNDGKVRLPSGLIVSKNDFILMQKSRNNKSAINGNGCLNRFRNTPYKKSLAFYGVVNSNPSIFTN